MEKPRPVMSEKFIQALKAAGIIDDDLEGLRRVVIDAQAGHVLTVWVERFGDERWLQVGPHMEGVDVRHLPA